MSGSKKNIDPSSKIIQKKVEPAKKPSGAQLAKGKVLDKESTRLKGLEKMKSKMAKSNSKTPSVKAKTVKRKPPTRGR